MRPGPVPRVLAGVVTPSPNYGTVLHPIGSPLKSTSDQGPRNDADETFHRKPSRFLSWPGDENSVPTIAEAGRTVVFWSNTDIACRPITSALKIRTMYTEPRTHVLVEMCSNDLGVHIFAPDIVISLRIIIIFGNLVQRHIAMNGRNDTNRREKIANKDIIFFPFSVPFQR
jgi:hypothetical protein